MADAETPGVTPGETPAATDEDAGRTPETVVNSDEQDGDFSAAFEEAAAKMAPAKSSDHGDAAPAGQDGNAGDEPKPADKAPPVEAPGAKPAAEKPDPLKDVSPEIRALFESQAAEIEKARKRAEGLDRRLKGFTRNAPAAPPAKSEEDKQKEGDAQKVIDDEIARLETDYPEIAGPLVKVLKAQAERLERMEGAVTPITEASRESQLQDAYDALSAEHPDFQTYGKPDADPNYAAWLKSQPAEAQAANKAYNDWLTTQKAPIRRMSDSLDPDECATVLTLFKTSQQVAAGGSPNGKPATATDDRRRRQMEGGAAVTSKTASASSGPADDDFDASFDHFARKLQASRV